MRKLLILGALFVMFVAVPAAMANDITVVDLGLGNAALSGYPAPYATVIIDLIDPTHAQITFDALTSGTTYQYLLGGEGAIAMNVNASSWLLGSPSGFTYFSSFNTPDLTNAGSGTEDGFGTFNQTVNDFDGYTHSALEIFYTLENLSGTWASASNVLTPNADGYSLAAHIFVAAYPAEPTASALASGYATNGVVPEPGSFLLLGSGLIGLACWAKRKVTR